MSQKYGGNDPNKTFYWRSQGLEITRFLHRNKKKAMRSEAVEL